MRASRFLAIVLYMAYLLNAGLVLILLPWSRAWGRLLAGLRPELALLLDQPWIRGAIAAFGVLHLLLVVWELLDPQILTPASPRDPESQNLPRS